MKSGGGIAERLKVSNVRALSGQTDRSSGNNETTNDDSIKMRGRFMDPRDSMASKKK